MPAPAAALPVEAGRGLVWLGALVITVAGFLAYWGIRDAPFIFDDLPAVVENESIRDLTQLGHVLRPPSEGAGIDSRPVINLSLALNYAISGRRLVKEAERLAGQLGIDDIYILTATAESFFHKLGYIRVPRGCALELLKKGNL